MLEAMPTATQRSRYRYLLGDTRTEASRLRAQAKLWDHTAIDLFDRLNVDRDWRVLEIGPGQGSLHIELRRRVRRPVDAVEPSAAFNRRLKALCARDGLGEGQIWESTLADSVLPERHYDLVFARWVFLFLPDPEAHVRKLAASLRPGGFLAIQDYHRDTLVMVPTPKEWAAFLQADHAFFASQGGDASIAGRLPAIYEKIGLDVVDITPHIKTGHPGSPVWTWISTYFFGVMQRLAEFSPFTPAQASRLIRQWRTASERPSSLLIAPAVIDVVGRRPRRSGPR